MAPQNFEEKVVWYSLIGTYIFFLLGAQYVVIPAIAWLLTLYVCKKLWIQTERTLEEEKIVIPLSIWIWLISIIIMGLGMIVGHVDFELGLFKIIASTANWARRWSLWALFPLISCLNIRPALIYRAVCILCLQSLVIIPIAYILIALNIPDSAYISPLKFLGGGPMYYAISLHSFDIDTNQVRLSLFAPWAPALGLVANIYFLLAREEQNKKWRWIGIISCIAMIVLSVSRSAILCLFIIPFLTLFIKKINQPLVHVILGISSFFGAVFASLAIELLELFEKLFNSSRASSSKVRKTLSDMALYKWEKEAPIWGHGATEEKGPIIVASMPIGSHSTWSGLLYVQGLVGFIAFIFPLLWSFIDLLMKAQRNKIAEIGLSILLVLFIFTFSENISDLAYIYWAGLLIIGIAFKSK
ncbi:O-antigen ligase family protein [Chroococcidiopsis sp. FACHB-1243]|uniref:O-antigen ligase family protein n=1 Tax=Chroococcidiopsis sp. [FACHB-1243] TaxID=2692781 RepID=UPI0017861615|nr:O-antigen ligase family protein [Chroococcidiopsis sp. [FACHB-1243]]MBD2304830.1 O-antigen ligase family protein [Chroococcidiopsis sp. [FACHB-1243]]